MAVATHHLEYLILSLSRTKVSLIRVADSLFQEIKDDNFPLTLDKGSDRMGTSFFSFGKILKRPRTDRSISGEVKFIGLLRSADQRLKRYLRRGDHLLLAGMESKLKEFENITHNNSHIVGEIVGSYTDHNRGDLIVQAEKLMHNLTHRKDLKQVESV